MPRDQRIVVFLSPKEVGALRLISSSAGFSISSVARSAILDHINHKNLKLLQDAPVVAPKPAPPPLDHAPPPLVMRLTPDEAQAQKEYEALYEEKVRSGEIIPPAPRMPDSKINQLLDE